jgi:hypothetical protein
MENVDKEFAAIANNDLTLGGQSLATTVASITTREIQEISTPSVDMQMQVDIDKAYELDGRPFIERPFYVGDVEFSDSAARYTLLATPIKFMPGDIARSNTSLLNLFKMGAYGIPKLLLNISMAGTITHAGCVLVGVLPPMPAYPDITKKQYMLINTILSGPHAYLYANEATSVSLPVPFYCNADLATLDMQTEGTTPTLDLTSINGNYSTLIFLVLNPLFPSSGSSKTLNIVIEACFEHYKIVVPTPRYVEWQSTPQGSRKPKSMFNPLYEDYERAKRNAERPQEWTNRSRRRRGPHLDGNALAIIAMLGTALTAGFRLYTMLAEGGFSPQSGILKKAGEATSGLLDMVAGSVKTIAGDAIDGVRSLVRSWTGLHNPNVATMSERVMNTYVNYANMVDAPQFFEKLDPLAMSDRIVKEPIFATAVDEMSISHVVSKRQYLGAFQVSTSTKIGALLWARPISPFQGGMFTDDSGVVCANNLELMHSLHRAWRGELKLEIAGILNNKQQVKLKVLKYYNPSITANTSYPAYRSIVNAPSHLLEYTQGGQNHEVSLPFLSRNDLMPCADNTSLEGLMHGMYYIYLAQPLASSDGSPETVDFNVFLSGTPTTQFFGYTKTNTYHYDFDLGFPAPSGELTQFEKALSKPARQSVAKHLHRNATSNPIDRETLRVPNVLLDTPKERAEAAEVLGMTHAQLNSAISASTEDGISLLTLPTTKFNPQSGKIKVMNAPQNQQYNSHEDNKESQMMHCTRLVPNLDIRNLIRRMYKTSTLSYAIDKDAYMNIKVPLSSYVGENNANWNYTPIETISRMYYGKTTGFKIRIMMTLAQAGQNSLVGDISQLSLRVYYFPQNLGYLTSNQLLASADINTSSITPQNLLSTIGEVPVTFQLFPKEYTRTTAMYEFVIPDTSFFKFLGSPEKFRNFSGTSTPPAVSTADFGTYVMQIANTNVMQGVQFTMETFVGLTDETRMGFHSIAPPFTISKKNAYYLGDGTTQTATIPTILNVFQYLGGFLG